MRCHAILASLVVALLALAAPGARAEHTPEHRFTISGYVYDDSGKPHPGTVAVKDPSGRLLGSVEASRTGYYEIHLHLHSDNVGEKLVVQSEVGAKELVVKFDPGDLKTERGAELNFGSVSPAAAWTAPTPALIAAAAVIVAGLVFAVARGRGKRKPETGRRKGPSRKR